MNFNENKNSKFDDNKKNEEPVYVMTVELEKGKSENIKIYSNSKPEELAYEFCKKNNLDFSSLSYLTNEILNLVKNIPNIENDKLENNLENEPIEEVDEEYYTQSVEKSNNIKKKINTSILNEIIDNDNQKDIHIIDLNNNSKLGDGKIDFNVNKDNNNFEDDINSFENFINKDEENGGSFNLDIELEKSVNNNNKNNYIENNNNSNNNNIDKNNKSNDIDHQNNNNNHIHSNSNSNIFEKSKKAFSPIIDKKRDMSTKGRMRRDKDNNFYLDFYQSRKKITSYENFFNNFQKKLLNHSNSNLNKNLIKKKIKSKKNKEQKLINIKRIKENNDIYNERTLLNSWNNNKNISQILFENLSNSKRKNVIEKNKTNSKNQNENINISKNKNDFENYLNNCDVLDEVYQNKINDETAFFVKGTSPNLIQRNNQKNSNTNNKMIINPTPNLKKSFSIEKYHKKSISSTKSRSERKNKNSLYKKRNSNFNLDKRLKNNFSFSPTNTYGFNKGINNNNNLKNNNNNNINNYNNINNNKNNISFKGFYFNFNKINKTFHKKRNSYTHAMLNRENCYLRDYYNKQQKVKIINNNLDINHTKYLDSYNNKGISDKKFEEIFNKENIFKKIFLLLDTKNKGFIDIKNEETKKIPIQIIIIISPIFNNLNNKDTISLNEFINKGIKLFDNLSFKNKKIIFDYTNKL